MPQIPDQVCSAWRRARPCRCSAPGSPGDARSLASGGSAAIVQVALALFVRLSLLWVLLYRFVNPPVTFTMLGDRRPARRARDWMSIEPDRPRHGPRGDRRRGQQILLALRLRPERSRRRCGATREGGSVLRGGSTISQQTAKNAFLWQGGGYFRKGLEAWFTLLIETIWGKRRIMEVYEPNVVAAAESGYCSYDLHDPPLAPHILDQEGEPGLQPFAEIAAALPQEGVLGGLLADRRAAADARCRLRALRRIAASIASWSKPLCEQNLLSSPAIAARAMSRSIRSMLIQSRGDAAAGSRSPIWVKVIGGFTKR